MIKFPKSLEMSAVNPDLSGVHMNVATMICAYSLSSYHSTWWVGDMTQPVNAAVLTFIVIHVHLCIHSIISMMTV